MKLARAGTIERAKREDGTFEFSLSSEAPYERYFGIEILSHTPEAVDLSRLGDGRHPLLLNHDTDRQIGVLPEAWLEDKRLRVRAKFSRSPLGQEIRQDVEDEIRTLVSVAYMVLEVQEMKARPDGTLEAVRTFTPEDFEREMFARHGQHWHRAGPAARRANAEDAPPIYLVTKWQPFEGSIVAIPADASVGVGRAADAETVPEPAAPQPPQPAPQAHPIITTERTTMQPTTKTPEELERARVEGILTLQEKFARFGVDVKMAQHAIRNGHSLEAFQEAILAKMESAASDVSTRTIGLTPAERQRYSLGRALVASVTGDWTKAGLERAASEATAKLFGLTPEGFFVPFDYFARDFNVGTAAEAGNLVPTELRGDLYTDALRNAMVLARMGVRILPGLSASIDIPRKATASTLGMLAESGSASSTKPVTAKATLTPKRVGAFIEVSKQALIQSAIALEPMLRDDLLMGAAALIEYQAINGAGTGNEMRGLRFTTGIGTVTAGANGGALTWDHLVDLESACANSNAEPGERAGYLVNTKLRGKAKKVAKSTYMPFIWTDGPTPLNGHRAGVTNSVPSNLTKGTSTTICSAALFSSDYSMSVLGLFGAPDVVVDPFTLADTGEVKITINQFADHTVRQPEAFAKVEDLLTT